MESVLLTVGRTREKWVAAGIEEYAKRLKRFGSFRIVELPDIKGGFSMGEVQQKEKEGEAILAKTQPGDMVVLLDERGNEFTSGEFASWLQKQMLTGRKRIVFVVGGPYGFSDTVYRRADSKLSLSRMTFNHEMVRAFFTEQLYRAHTILAGMPYHNP